MPGTFSAFSIGTGHTSAEHDSTIVCLYDRCVASNMKMINEGVGTGTTTEKVLGGFFGKGLDERCAAVVKKIKGTSPNRVNLAGHSRGGALCHMIANDLADSGFAGEINMIVLDPVNQSSHTDRAKVLRKTMKLGEYVAIVMENISMGADSMTFPLTEVQPGADKFRKLMRVINMPGKHGSGTQTKTAIGEATYRTMMHYMDKWRTTFSVRYKPAEIANSYARIHLENPVTKWTKGNVEWRNVIDGEKEGSQGTKFRKKQIGRLLEHGSIDGGEAPDLRNTGYFFNEFHAKMFHLAFPACYERMAGGKDYWEHKAQSLQHKFQLKGELAIIATSYPDIEKSMKQCFLL